MESRNNNVIKIIAVSFVSAVISIIVDFIMFNQYHYSLTSATVLTRVTVLIILLVLVCIFSAWDLRFSNYVTILAMLYYGIIDFGGVMQMHMPGWLGIVMRMVSLAGIFLCIYGLVLGMRQRTIYNQNRYQEKRGK